MDNTKGMDCSKDASLIGKVTRGEGSDRGCEGEDGRRGFVRECGRLVVEGDQVLDLDEGKDKLSKITLR